MRSLGQIIPAVVLDWAGTTVDYGCLAPVVALRRVLAHHGLPISAAAARVGMGLPKKEHLHALLAARGAATMTDELYLELERAIFDELEPHAKLIDGTLEFVAWLREGGVKVGTTTGYTAAMMEIVSTAAARQGYVPDWVATPDAAGAGRPLPAMMRANAERLGVGPPSSLVKIGDTPIDVTEGKYAGAWTVGVALTGNALGLPPAEIATLPPIERRMRFAAARESLRAAGADYVVDSLAECPPVLLEIYARVRDGERPQVSPLTT